MFNCKITLLSLYWGFFESYTTINILILNSVNIEEARIDRKLKFFLKNKKEPMSGDIHGNCRCIPRTEFRVDSFSGSYRGL